MSLRLYEVDEELQVLDVMIDEYASENNGEIPDFLNDELERLQGERAEKCLKVGAWIKNLIAESTAYKNEAKILTKKAKACDNKVESLKGFLAYVLEPNEKHKDSRVTLTWRKSKRVIVDAIIDDIPEEYVKVTKAADLSGLKTAITAGAIIEGVHIQEFNNLSIQ
jgi:hypothetical protein